MVSDDNAQGDIFKIELEEKHILKRAPIIEQERATAIRDLLRSHKFTPVAKSQKPYYVKLGVKDYRLSIKIRDEKRVELEPVILPLRPFKKLIKDYFLICDGFMQAYRSGDRAKVETLDMTRRALHNEGALLLKDYLKDRVEMDIQTSRGFFTLICVLHI